MYPSMLDTDLFMLRMASFFNKNNGSQMIRIVLLAVKCVLVLMFLKVSFFRALSISWYRSGVQM